MSTTQHLDQIRINVTQRRANKHGFALAMRDAPTDAEQVKAAARALDDIITDINYITPRRINI